MVRNLLVLLVQSHIHISSLFHYILKETKTSGVSGADRNLSVSGYMQIHALLS